MTKRSIAVGASLICLAACTPAAAPRDRASSPPSTTTPTTAPPIRTYTVPTSITANCTRDMTRSLLRWIGSVPNHAILQFGTAACYRIEGTLEIKNRVGLELEGNGSTFQSFHAPDDQRPLWRWWGGRGIVMHSMNLVGSYGRGGTFNSDLQHAHGVDLRGTSATLDAVNVSRVAGDCVYFGLGADSRTRSSGSYHDSTCSLTGRNGVSITAGDGVLVQHNGLSDIGYEVADVEPNTTTGNWGANGVSIDTNVVGTYRRVAFSVVENAPVDNLTFSNNTDNLQGLRMVIGDQDDVGVRSSTIAVTGNSSSVRTGAGPVNARNVDGLTVTGNIQPLTAGTYAVVSNSSKVNVSGNTIHDPPTG